MNTKDKLMENKVQKLWKSWKKRYDSPLDFDYFVPFRILSLLTSEVERIIAEVRSRDGHVISDSQEEQI